ncbi:MAG: non-canonical purine NTP pyrophosphatase [Candidatus Aenigmatarchaeota archaeon]|nr:MAG: non-canonical purine NTP pyrophosphatase [Candidatus Aenigmarchaeota archaeon]
MEVIVVSGNRNKFEEIRLVLREYRIKCVHRNLELVERGRCLEEIAKNKATEAWKIIKKPLIVDDTGIFFVACRNFPGVHARRVYEEIGLAGLLDKLKGKGRDAYFKTVLVFTDGNIVRSFEGELKGVIADKAAKISRKHFPYEAIFIPAGYKKPLSALSLKEKIAISHRAIAVRKFAQFYKTYEKSKLKEFCKR